RHAAPRRPLAQYGARAPPPAALRAVRRDLFVVSWRDQRLAGVRAVAGKAVGVSVGDRRVRRVRRLPDLSLLRRAVRLADRADGARRVRYSADIGGMAAAKTRALFRARVVVPRIQIILHERDARTQRQARAS